MTLELVSINGSSKNKQDEIEFDIAALLNDVAFDSIKHKVPSKYKDVDSDCLVWLENNTVSDYVKTEGDIRIERKVVFAETIDKLNAVWASNLTEDQITRLNAWRQEWLDYPNTLVEPTTLVDDVFPILTKPE